MECDFQGYATKAGIRCTDGRTIMPGAFKHQDAERVPLVWQHNRNSPENVIGHMLLEDRSDGTYAYGFFNETQPAKHAGQLLEHKDINMLSIYANQLVERGKNVMHGMIREVSLVLAGANPGALIEGVTIRHADGTMDEMEDEAIIMSGEYIILEHSDEGGEEDDDDDEDENENDDDEDTSTNLGHADGDTETIEDIYESLSAKQKDVVHFMLGQALEATGDDEENSNDNAAHGNTDTEGQNTMTHSNVFEGNAAKTERHEISHDDMKELLENADHAGSLKKAVKDYALQHGITDIDVLFPEARNVSDVPEWIKRRTEWVSDFLARVRKSPFSRIRTISADLTFEEARAKGYIKGHLKKEEFFGVAARTTTPTTVYKKQTLDRDDIIDITDFDVISWLKAEMRVMLDEEVARAALLSDGRTVGTEDKINEGNIRPIAKDDELYTTTVNVNVDDASSSMAEVVDAVIANRYKLKGTGMPTFYTTEYWIARFLLLRDGNQRRMYENLAALALELRVDQIVSVEAMMEDPDMIGILVNPVDYSMGTDRGGQVSMFDDFDIDYNKNKYLIETRLSGALTRVKSAMVLRRTAGVNVLATPTEPGFVPGTGVVTIPTITGVVYKNDTAAGSTASPGPQTALAAGASKTYVAVPATGYFFATSDDDSWEFTRDA